MARRLVSEGWRGTSNRLRRISRWRVPPRPAHEVLDSEFLRTTAGQYIATVYQRSVVESTMYCDDTEDQYLNPRMHRAFKHAENYGGTT